MTGRGVRCLINFRFGRSHYVRTQPVLTNMTSVRSTSLLMGLLSLLLALWAAFIIWLWSANIRTNAPSPPAASYAESVQSATSCESLKRACVNLARSSDTDTLHIRYLSSELKSLSRGVILVALVWGVMSGVSFLYIYVAVRRAERSTK